MNKIEVGNRKTTRCNRATAGGGLTRAMKNALLRVTTGAAGEVSAGEIRTRTTIIFPEISPRTRNILATSDYYDR